MVIQQMSTKYLFVLGTRLGSGDRATNKVAAVPALILVEETGNKWQSKYMWTLISGGDKGTLAWPVPTYLLILSIKATNPFSHLFLSHLSLQKFLTQISLMRKSHLCQGSLNFSVPSLVN